MLGALPAPEPVKDVGQLTAGLTRKLGDEAAALEKSEQLRRVA
jgi:hypothetical protein